jgi:F0F1-type ATP synthase delta subunit
MELIGTGWDVVVFNALGYFLVWKCFQVSKLRHQTVSEALEEQAVKLGKMNDTPEMVTNVVDAMQNNQHTQALYKRLDEFTTVQDRAMEAQEAGITGFVHHFPLMTRTVERMENTLAVQENTLARVGEAYAETAQNIKAFEGEIAQSIDTVDSVKSVADSAANSAASNAVQLTEMNNRFNNFERGVVEALTGLNNTLGKIDHKVDSIREDI